MNNYGTHFHCDMSICLQVENDAVPQYILIKSIAKMKL